MKFEATTIEGCLIASSDDIRDHRGFFARVWCAEELEAVGGAAEVAQINMSQSAEAGMIRGLHWQEPPHGEAKFVRCINGAIFDVCADVRRDSTTFGQWFGIELNPRNRLALVVPEGCAHAYQSLVPDSEVMYLTNVPYVPEAERGVRWDDPFFSIRWPITTGVIVSDKDASWPSFGEETPE